MCACVYVCVSLPQVMKVSSSCSLVRLSPTSTLTTSQASPPISCLDWVQRGREREGLEGSTLSWKQRTSSTTLRRENFNKQRGIFRSKIERSTLYNECARWRGADGLQSQELPEFTPLKKTMCYFKELIVNKSGLRYNNNETFSSHQIHVLPRNNKKRSM